MISEKPLVTIITITFNLINSERKELFRQTVESVFNQTYSSIEHIIVDGASNDGTLDLIKEYYEKKWIKYISEPDKGIYDAMNKGIRMARGKYIAFLNSDDYYHEKDGVERSVCALEISNADFSYAPALIIKEDGSCCENHPHSNPIITDVFHVMPFCHQTMFTKRSVLIKENMFDATFKSAGDYDFLIRICLNNYSSVYIPYCFTTFRFSGVSIIDNDRSIKEVGYSYYKNYSRLCKIKKSECEKIYCNGYKNIPGELAEVLKKNTSYFDFNEYRKMNSLKRKVASKIEFLFRGKLRQYLQKVYYGKAV